MIRLRPSSNYGTHIFQDFQINLVIYLLVCWIQFATAEEFSKRPEFSFSLIEILINFSHNIACTKVIETQRTKQEAKHLIVIQDIRF